MQVMRSPRRLLYRHRTGSQLKMICVQHFLVVTRLFWNALHRLFIPRLSVAPSLSITMISDVITSSAGLFEYIYLRGAFYRFRCNVRDTYHSSDNAAHRLICFQQVEHHERFETHHEHLEELFGTYQFPVLSSLLEP
jgi:hypothetical protein